MRSSVLQFAGDVWSDDMVFAVEFYLVRSSLLTAQHLHKGATQVSLILIYC